jgi:hypothetical protein
MQTGDSIASELRGIFYGEIGEFQSVKTGQSAFGGKPNVPVISLDDLVYRILEQSIFDLPVVVKVFLTKRL